MLCSICQAWTSVSETRKGGNGSLKRVRLCANGHRFATTETAILLAGSSPTIAPSPQKPASPRVMRWMRDQFIYLDTRAAYVVAAEYALSGAAVSLIRRRLRQASTLDNICAI